MTDAQRVTRLRLLPQEILVVNLLRKIKDPIEIAEIKVMAMKISLFNMKAVFSGIRYQYIFIIQIAPCWDPTND